MFKMFSTLWATLTMILTGIHHYAAAFTATGRYVDRVATNFDEVEAIKAEQEISKLRSQFHALPAPTRQTA